MKGKHECLSNECPLLMFLQNSWVCFSDLRQKNWEGQPGLTSSMGRAIFMPWISIIEEVILEHTDTLDVYLELGSKLGDPFPEKTISLEKWSQRDIIIQVSQKNNLKLQVRNNKSSSSLKESFGLVRILRVVSHLTLNFKKEKKLHIHTMTFWTCFTCMKVTFN